MRSEADIRARSTLVSMLNKLTNLTGRLGTDDNLQRFE